MKFPCTSEFIETVNNIASVSGLGFHFEINDLPIFLKGANWIPAGKHESNLK